MKAKRQQAAQQCVAVLNEKFFKAFSDPTRIHVFQRVVLLGRADIGEIAESLPQDRSVVSRHLQVLANARVLKAHKEGRRILYTVNPTEIEKHLMQMLELTRQLAAVDCN